jgi:hypothetical protein
MNGTHMLIYTTEQGGYFKTPIASSGEIRLISEEEFDEIRRTREFVETDWLTDSSKTVRPSFIALARIEDNYDFILGCSRDDKKGIAIAGARRADAA